jgi:hypothetical protein
MEQVLLQNSKNIKALIDLMKAHEENIKKMNEEPSEDKDVSMNDYLLYVQCDYSNILAPSSKICPMTQTYFVPTDKVIVVRECGHLFKREPFLEWIKTHTNCPRCTARLL